MRRKKGSCEFEKGFVKPSALDPQLCDALRIESRQSAQARSLTRSIHLFRTPSPSPSSFSYSFRPSLLPPSVPSRSPPPSPLPHAPKRVRSRLLTRVTQPVPKRTGSLHARPHSPFLPSSYLSLPGVETAAEADCVGLASPFPLPLSPLTGKRRRRQPPTSHQVPQKYC